MMRIIGREGGYPDFFDLRRKLIAKYGEGGANTLAVLQAVCPEYRLQCQKVNVIKAMQAITAKRPVVARFRLTDPEWEIFSEFYRRGNGRGILSRDNLDITLRPRGAKPGGHAVVLTSYDSKSLCMMNSWGDQWANNGFFRIKNAEVLNLEFIDVFWTLDNLLQSEKDSYEKEGANVADKLIYTLKGLQTVKYQCPLCHAISKVVEYKGRLLQATCPRCRGTFNVHEAGDDLALNMYLTSLAS